MTIAKTLTAKDSAALDLIRACGHVRLGSNGEAALESDSQVTAYRVHRLASLGLLEPSGDTLFADVPSQTFKPVTETTGAP